MVSKGAICGLLHWNSVWLFSVILFCNHIVQNNWKAEFKFQEEALCVLEFGGFQTKSLNLANDPECE